MGKKIGGALMAVLLFAVSGLAWAQAKKPAPPPTEKPATSPPPSGTPAEIKRQPFKPGPLLWFKVPTMQDMAGDQEVEDESLQLFMKSEDMPSSKYLQNRYTTEAPLAMATRDISLDKRLQNMTRIFESWSLIGMLRELDKPGFEAIGRCMTAGTTDPGDSTRTITPSSPRIGPVCLSKYQADPKAFVMERTGLSDTSIMEQIFGGDTLSMARTYVGDAQLKETLQGGTQKTATISQVFTVAATSTNAGWVYQSFLDMRNNTLIPAIEVTLGASCEKQPTPPLVWDATKFPNSSIDLPEIVLKEAYSDSTACSALKTALASEALKREAAFVMTQITLAQADMTLHPVARDQLAWWQGSLERRIALWEQAEARTGTKFEDVVHSIQDSRFARLRPLVNAVQTPVVP